MAKVDPIFTKEIGTPLSDASNLVERITHKIISIGSVKNRDSQGQKTLCHTDYEIEWI